MTPPPPELPSSQHTARSTTDSSNNLMVPSTNNMTPEQALTRQTSQSELTEMRTLFEAELTSQPALYHPLDVDRVRTDDWQLLRFLERSNTIQEAFEALIAALQWKKQTVGVHDKRDEDFPREFYELNGIEILGRDSEDRLVVWVTSKYSRDFSDLKPYIKEFIVHEIELMDRLAGQAGLFVISDAKHAGLFSVDLELTRFMQDIVSRYYPGTVKQILITNLSMLLDPILKLVLSFLTAELRATLKVVSRKKLTAHIAPLFIPVEYGGARKDRELRCPEKAPSYTEMPGIKLTEAQKTRYRALLKQLGIE